jgi:hypothetical protein
MPVRFLSDAELARLSSWPDEIAAEDLVTFFTLSPDDLAWLAGFNRDETRLGAAVQLCALPWLTPCPRSRIGRTQLRSTRSHAGVQLPKEGTSWKSAPGHPLSKSKARAMQLPFNPRPVRTQQATD